MVALAFLCRRARHQVKNGFTIRTGAPSTEAVDNFVDRQVVIYDSIELQVLVPQYCFEGCRLGDRTRKAIQEKSSATFETLRALGNKGKDDFIRNQLTPLHILLSRGQ